MKIKKYNLIFIAIQLSEMHETLRVKWKFDVTLKFSNSKIMKIQYFINFRRDYDQGLAFGSVLSQKVFWKIFRKVA